MVLGTQAVMQWKFSTCRLKVKVFQFIAFCSLLRFAVVFPLQWAASCCPDLLLIVICRWQPDSGAYVASSLCV